MSVLVIPSPNTDRSLLTLAELRAAAGVSDGSKDSILVPLGNYISAMITSVCKVARSGAIPPTLRLETVEETFRLKSEQQSLVLARRPVTEIDTITVSDSEQGTDDYEYEAASGLLYRLCGERRAYWPCGETVVTYSAGYATVPDDLKYAAIRFVQAENTNAGRDPYLKRLKIEGLSEREWWVEPSKETMIPPDVMSILVGGGYVNMVTA